MARKQSGDSNSNWQGGKIEVSCAFCGNKIFKAQWELKKNKRAFCNQQCLYAWRATGFTGVNNPRYTQVEVCCSNCGNKLERKVSSANKHKNHFCNMECKSQWGGVAVECFICKTIRRVDRNHYIKSRNGIFICTKECWVKYRSLYFLGKNSTNWRGGIEHFPYDERFNDELRANIRKRDCFTCKWCGARENGRKHDVHHINYDKLDSRESNLITLCRSCHMLTNGNRNYWEKQLQNIISELSSGNDMDCKPFKRIFF
jgi:hypothetical protein